MSHSTDTTRRHTRAARSLAIAVVGVALLSSVASTDHAHASSTAPEGKAVGHKAEHGTSSHNDTSAPLSQITPAKPVKAHTHPDSPMPTPAGPIVADPVVQQSSTLTAAPSSASNFAGMGANGSAPSDANGAVGPNHYVDLVNSRLQIFTKTGTSLLGPVPTNTLWANFGGECQTENDGDGTVRYDALADRWVVSQFALGVSGNGPFFQCVAVSATADPTGSYYRYAFAFASFPDYPKLAVWPDGYYQTMNMFNSAGAFTGADSCVYERSKMLSGQAAGVECFNATTAYGALLPGDLDGTTPPPAGAPNMQLGLGADNTHLASFRFQVDWSPGAAGTSFTETDIAVAAYTGACGGGGTCIPQLGTTQLLDSLADRMMYRYAYRNFGDHESWVATYSVTAAGVSAPRWFELRRTPAATTGPLAVYQDSTYAPDAAHRWMGSVAMDGSGDIALAYSESSATAYPAIAYTGRTPADPLASLEPETVFLTGGGAQTGGLRRWGDYTSMNVDTSDGCSFWFTNQYIPSSGSFNWATQIGSFAFPSCVPRTDSDFSVALFPVSGVAAPGGSAFITTVSTGRTAGTAASVSLSATGVPSGVSVSFSPVTVTAGAGAAGSSTMAVAAAVGATPGTYSITVDGVGTGTDHAATFSLTVPGTAIANGGFETGDLTGWTSPTGTASVVSGGHSGLYAVALGATTPTNGDSTVTQSFTLAQSSTLSFWYRIVCPDVVAYDWATVALTDVTASQTTTLLPHTCTNNGTWVQVSSALPTSAVGHVFTLTMTNHDDNYAADPTVTFYDDVVLTSLATPDFSLSASPAAQTVVVAGATSFSASIAASGGFAGVVALGVSGLPAGATASFAPASVVGSGGSVLSVVTGSSTPVGTYPLTITATSGALVHTASVSLTVNPVPNFSLSASPAAQTVVVAGATSFSASIAASGGFAGVVALGVSGLPAGATASFAPASMVGSGGSVLSVVTGSSTPVGTYPLTITATSGALVHTASVSLTVNPVPNFTLTVSPTSRSTRRGTTTSFTVTVTDIGGYTGLVNLSLAVAPLGPTGTFNPVSLTAGASTLTMAAGTKLGTFNLMVTGTSGALVHTATISLTVTSK